MDQMQIEILEDGQIKFSTDAISTANHASADEFLAEVEKMLGCERQTTKKKGWHVHTHENGKVVAHSH